MSNADSATNASNLGGSPASDYRVRCPADLRRIEGLCFEPTLRAATDWTSAAEGVCEPNRRLPTDGELALVISNTGATNLSNGRRPIL